MKKSINYIVLTYKSSLAVLLKNLTTLINSSVLIVDNSEDEKIALDLQKIIRSSYHHLIINPKNLGYTGGMNVGMKRAFGEGAEWVVLLNDDVELSKEAVDLLVKTLEKEKPGIVGPYGGYLEKNRWTTILPTAEEKKKVKTDSSVDYISGSFMAIHKKVYDVIQGFYPDFFMYYEDVDVCIQARKAGFPIIQIDLPNIHHQEGKSIERGSNLHEYYLARNHLLFVERQAPPLIKIREILRLPKTMWEHYFFMNRAALRGIFDFLFIRYGKAPMKQ